ncbi:MAG: aminodeoxychorismate lyase [Plesiomonas sp.]|uniref:aminodeoxychorismate lyase n=1 Tax=Plesiomonas sp. TaxID=2486279 RepID=UPI003F3F00DF
MLINGLRDAQLNVADRGLAYGDGSFTTARVVRGKVQLQQAHIERLWSACQRLSITFPDIAILQSEIEMVAREIDQGILKVIITRGLGGRGYSSINCDNTTRIISVAQWPMQYTQWQHEGIRLGESQISLGINPLLAGMKHLNRLEQVLIRQQLDQHNAVNPLQIALDDLIVCDSAGYVVECCAANVFWRKGQHLFTPQLDWAGVSGVMRKYIMAYCDQQGWHCEAVRETVKTLADADEIFICNALLPVVPVRYFQHRQFSDFSATRQIQRFLDDSL